MHEDSKLRPGVTTRSSAAAAAAAAAAQQATSTLSSCLSRSKSASEIESKSNNGAAFGNSLASDRDSTQATTASVVAGGVIPEATTGKPQQSLVQPEKAPPFTPRRMGYPGRLSLQMPSKGPLSPVLDPALGYSVARRPRLDFARACTSLHHSTLAEKSSPDSSPVTPSCFPIPRNNNSSININSNFHHHNNNNNNSSNTKALDSPIGLHPASSHASSLGSTSMLDYSAPSGDDSDSTDEDLDVDFDVDVATPSAMTTAESAASLSLRNHQKARMGGRVLRTRRFSGPSGFGFNSSPTTPPIQLASAWGYFGRKSERKGVGLGLESGGQFSLESRGAEEEKEKENEKEKDGVGAVRRVVQRRGSLLPKTKNFQRIKAALIEEASPVDMEVKREAEITRQIREEASPPPSTSATNPEQELEDIREEDEMSIYGPGSASKDFKSFTFTPKPLQQQQKYAGLSWWGDQMDFVGSPPSVGVRMSSDGDIVMNSDSAVNSPITGFIPPRTAKRRRTQEELFEPNAFKRRAVSPGLSHSPILGASSPAGVFGGGKRLNFQGVNDTHDGLMKMSLQ
ncbi:hypothetical protein RUND412_000097 [Rhizina undulata]